MYRVYLRRTDGQVIGEVRNPVTREEAEEVFTALINEAGYDGFAIAAVLTELNRPIAVHRFDREAGKTRFGKTRQDPLTVPSFH